MHARVTSLSGSPSEVDGGIENFRSNVVPYVRAEGKGAILLVDRASGNAVAITLREGATPVILLARLTGRPYQSPA